MAEYYLHDHPGVGSDGLPLIPVSDAHPLPTTISGTVAGPITSSTDFNAPALDRGVMVYDATGTPTFYTTSFLLWDNNVQRLAAVKGPTNWSDLAVYKLNTPGDTNTELVRLYWDNAATQFTLATEKTGSGTVRNLAIVTPTLLLAPVALSGTPGVTTGAWLNQATQTFTDSNTAGSGTAASMAFNVFARPTLAATNASVTTTDAATVYIAGGPIAGTNETITSAWGLWNVGNTRLGGNVYFGSGLTTVYDSVNNRIGIGTAVPDSPLTASRNAATLPAIPAGTILHVGLADGTSVAMLLDAFAAIPSFLFRRSQGTAASPTAITANLALGQLSFRGYGATGYSSAGRAALQLFSSENWTDAAQGTYFVFTTTATGTVTTAESFRISSNALTIADAVNVVTGTGTGTIWGAATGQKQAWWGATPVVQQVLATGAAHTVDEVITLLQTLGLCKQS